MAIQFLPGFRSKNLKTYKRLPLHTKSIDLYGDKHVIIKLPKIRVLRLLARSLLLALIFATFPLLRTLSVASPSSASPIIEPESVPDFINAKVLPLLIHDLANEGLLKTGDNAVFVGSGKGNGIDNAVRISGILNAKDAEIISTANLDRQSSIPGELFDFAFTYDDFHASSEFIDRTLKVGGIAVVQLTNDPSSAFDKPSNYKTVYFRRFQATNILAMRKIGYEDATLSTQRRLLGYDHATEAKKAALENLEDVLLEPPRAASGKSSRYLKKTRYLPDLMGDSLESYPRRVFIDVGLPEKEGGSGTGWFAKNYPTRNLDFEMYKIETVTEELSGKEVPQVEEVGMSDWLKNNVKGEEYVVMKAEAEVVEEMVKSKAIRLVDELFLECRPRRNGNGSKKAYWECLALYGKLRDEGVAVHQWWG